MGTASKSIRVFISSTFRDMHAERDHLVTVVFPELRERVEQLGLEFFDVDLRWGVPEKNTDGETANSWEYCRQWIERVEPLFVCILGQRYGWVPKVGDFRDPADQARQAAIPRSITDIEVRHAVLNDRRKHRSYFYLRETPVPPLPPDATASQRQLHDEFVDPPEQLDKLATLKGEIRQCGRPVRSYKCEWTGQGFTDLNDFGRLVLSDLWSGLLRDPRYVSKEAWRQALGADPDADPRYTDETFPVPQELCEKIVALVRPVPEAPLEVERQQMEAFAESRLRWFQGRANELAALSAFVCSTEQHAPRLAVVAAMPGQGKSALLAKLSSLIPPSSTFLVTHFIGATERSSSALVLIRRLLDELDHSGVAWKEEATDDEAKHDFESLRKRLSKRLGEYAGDRRIVLLIDALNQLSDGHDLLWLPQRYGAGVRVVVSSMSDPSARDGSPEQRVMTALSARSSASLPIALGPLAPEDVHAVVIDYLREYCKELDAPYVHALGDLPQASNPLYLLVALGELRTLGGNDMNRVVPAIISSLAQEYPDTVSLFTWVLQRLEVFGAEEMKHWCMYLALGRVGVSSRELAELLRRKLGGAAAAQALLIERGLRRYLQRRGNQLDYFHSQLRQAVMAKYSMEGGKEQGFPNFIASLHSEMASYFSVCAQGDGQKGAWGKECVRGLSECVYHFIQAKDYDRAGSLLGSFPFLLHKIRMGLFESVLEDFDLFCSVASADEILKLDGYTAFFREKAHMLRRGNTEWPAYKILMQLAIEHADDSPVTLGAEQWLSDGRCDWAWLRRRRRRPHAQAGPCLAVLEGHTKSIEGALVLSDGRILSWSEDETLRIWDRESGRCLVVLEGHSSAWIEGAQLLPDGRILSWAKDATLRIWDSHSGDCISVLRGHAAWVKGSLVLADGRILSWAKDATLRIWDSRSGECLSTLIGHSKEVTGALLLADGRILSWAKEKSPRIWDSRSGECMIILDGHSEAVTGALLLPDERMLSWAGGSGSKDLVLRVWSTQSGACIAVLEGHSDRVAGAQLLPDGRILSWSADMTLRTWDSQSGECIAVLQGHTGQVNGALALPGGRVLSWSADMTLRTWGSHSGACIAVLEGHSGWVSGAIALPNGHIVSWAGGYASTDQALRIWDEGSGKCIAVLDGHSEWVNGVLVLPDGRVLSWAVDNALRIWGLSGECLAVVHEDSGAVESTLILPDGRVLSWAVGYKAKDFHLRIWDGPSGECTVVLRGHTKDVSGALVLQDGRILTWARDTTLRVWDGQSGECLVVLEGHSRDVCGALVLPDERVLSWSEDSTLRTWDSLSGKCISALRGHSKTVWTALVLPDGHVLSLALDKTLRTWDSLSGEQLAVLEGHTDRIIGMLVLSDGHILSWARDGQLRIWDSRSGACCAILAGHTKEVNGALALPDGRILSWARDTTLRIWGLSGKCLAVLQTSGSYARGLAS
jgi:WD40 repeat protein